MPSPNSLPIIRHIIFQSLQWAINIKSMKISKWEKRIAVSNFHISHVRILHNLSFFISFWFTHFAPERKFNFFVYIFHSPAQISSFIFLFLNERLIISPVLIIKSYIVKSLYWLMNYTDGKDMAAITCYWIFSSINNFKAPVDVMWHFVMIYEGNYFMKRTMNHVLVILPSYQQCKV